MRYVLFEEFVIESTAASAAAGRCQDDQIWVQKWHLNISCHMYNFTKVQVSKLHLVKYYDLQFAHNFAHNY